MKKTRRQVRENIFCWMALPSVVFGLPPCLKVRGEGVGGGRCPSPSNNNGTWEVTVEEDIN